MSRSRREAEHALVRSAAGGGAVSATQPSRASLERDLRGYGGNPPPTPWPAGTKAVVSIAVHLEEGAELSISDGDATGEQNCEGMLIEEGHREFAVESFFEYGARCGVWRLLRIFSTFGVKATFFCCGRSLSRNPLLGRRLVELGHEVACHGWRYLPYHGFSDSDQRREIESSRNAVREYCGVEPVGWVSRVPTPSTREQLVRVGGFAYDCDGYADDLPYWAGTAAGPMLVVPNTFDNSDEKFWPLPNNSGFTNPANFLNSMSDSLGWLLAEAGAVARILPVALRPRISGRPSKAEQIHQFLASATTQAGVRFMTRGEIAKLWTEKAP